MADDPPRPRQPWDPGLQIERTTLAWVRTTLAFVAGLLVLLRLIANHSTLAAAACAALTLPLGCFVGWITWRRHLHGERQLHADQPLPSGRRPAAITLLAILTGCFGLIYVLL